MSGNLDWIRNNYDVVVIGAGIGGLTAAAILARNGKKVLVLEKCNQIGGRSRETEHEGFRIANNFRSQVVDQLLQAKELTGADFELLQCDKPVLHFFNVEKENLFGLPHDMATDGPAWLKNLGIHDEDMMPFMMGLKGMLELDDEAIDKMMQDHVSFNQYVTGCVESDRVRRELFSVTQYSSHAIFDWNVFAAGDFIKKILPCLATGDIEIFNGDPSDTAINDAFAEVITKNGGDIRLLCEAKEVVIKDGLATGVVFHDCNTDTWHFAGAKDVVTNLPVWLNLNLIDNSLLPSDWIANVKEYQKHQGIGVGVWLGLDKKVTDSTSYFRLVAPDPDTGTDTRYIGGAFFLSNNSPALAPDGKQLFFIESFMEERSINDWDALEEHCDNLKLWADRLFRQLKEKGMGGHLLEDVLIMEKRVVHKPSWGVVNWTVVPKPEVNVPGIGSLYFIGDTIAAPSWGFDQAVGSGILAARNILA